MGRVVSHMTMSLDGYVATDTDEVGTLFDWYGAGPVQVPSGNPDVRFDVDEAGAQMLRSLMDDVGALVSGRRLFDLTDGWGDRHPVGAPVVVVTHTPPDNAGRWPRTRFAGGVEEAVALAQEIAAGKDVTLASADVIGQALDLGLVDEIAVSLVPMLMGGGKAYFGSITRSPVLLDDPTVVTGTRATHLTYRVRR